MTEGSGSYLDDALPKQLEEEYKLLISRWEDFDRRALSIKGWVTAGAVVATITLRPETPPMLIIFAATIILTAWFMEAIWKSWQHANAPRIMAIERYFRGENDFPIRPFQMQSSWVETNGKTFSLRLAFREMFRLFVCLPYLVFVALFAIYALQEHLQDMSRDNQAQAKPAIQESEPRDAYRFLPRRLPVRAEPGDTAEGTENQSQDEGKRER